MGSVPRQGSPAGLAKNSSMETLTLTQIEERYATTRKAIARRVERGSVRSLLDDAGRRVVPLVELERLGLQPRNTPGGEGEPRGEPHVVGGTEDHLAPLLDRLERLVAENARLKLITERAESLENSERDERIRLEAELKAARARIAELETRRKRWWQRSSKQPPNTG